LAWLGLSYLKPELSSCQEPANLFELSLMGSLHCEVALLVPDKKRKRFKRKHVLFSITKISSFFIWD